MPKHFHSFFFLFFSLVLLGSIGDLGSQNIFTNKILPIIVSTNCGNSYCHGSGTTNLTFTGTPQEIYDQLVNVSPQNMASAAKGHKIVLPGYPERSLLYRKINGGLHNDSNLDLNEGDPMPAGGSMTNTQKEMIRQWIYMGAPFDISEDADEDVWLNEEVIADYYTNGGVGTDVIPAAPAANEGFQVKFGPFFLAPGIEREILKVFDPQFTTNQEINRIEVFMNGFSHHYILYKYNSTPNQNPGIRELNMGNVLQSPLGFGDANFMAIWQESEDFRLPEGTAYKMDTNDEWDLNYHIKNYSTTSVLAADIYMNVYLQPDGTAEKEMHSDLAYYGMAQNQGLGILSLSVPANQETTVGEEFSLTNQQMNIWMLSSHTHKLGQDYKIYLQDDAGNQGQMIFDGKYNQDYTAYQGFYDYQDPPIRYFDHLLEIQPGQKLYHEAKFINNTNENVGFGLTTDDEMFITIVQYTLGANHQAPLTLNEELSEACIDELPIPISTEGISGAIGDGVIGNYFYPDIAGLGTHDITLNCCGAASQTVTVNVLDNNSPELTVTYSSSSEVIVNDDFDYYEWYVQPINGSGEYELFTTDTNIFDAYFIFYEPIMTYCIAWDEGGCKQVSEVIYLSIEGIEDIQGEAGLIVFPNPANEDRINISYNLLEGGQQVYITLYDLSGKEIMKVSDISTGTVQNKEINIQQLTTGIYFAKLETTKGVWMQKISVN